MWDHQENEYRENGRGRKEDQEGITSKVREGKKKKNQLGGKLLLDQRKKENRNWLLDLSI